MSVMNEKKTGREIKDGRRGGERTRHGMHEDLTLVHVPAALVEVTEGGEVGELRHHHVVVQLLVGGQLVGGRRVWMMGRMMVRVMVIGMMMMGIKMKEKKKYNT